jgi:hypothetical protein
MRISVGSFGSIAPIESNWWSGRSSTAPPEAGPMMFAHMRNLAKLSARRVAKAKQLDPQR